MLAITVPVLGLLYSIPGIPERLLVGIGSVLIGHTAWHWLVERLAVLRKVEWPSIWMTLPSLTALALLLVFASVLVWTARRWVQLPNPSENNAGDPGRRHRTG